MTYYPIIIPTLNRYEHFRQCIESLSKNTYADKTEVIIGLDYPPSEKYREGYERIKSYIPTITGFRKVTVIERQHNIGAYKNWNDLKEYAFNYYDAVIATEDDNVFSPCFLDFVNKALEIFSNNSKISRVSAYSFVELYNQGGYEVYLRPVSSAWGVGEWKMKNREIEQYLNLDYFRNVLNSFRLSFKIFCVNPSDLNFTISMVKKGGVWDDVARSVLNILHNTYEISPSISLSKNMGHDGSGEHCVKDVTGKYSEQELGENVYFNFDNINWNPNWRNKYNLFRIGMSDGFVKKLWYMIRTSKRYIDYRLHRL